MRDHTDLECPLCSEWIEILPGTPQQFKCPWCKKPLTLSVDAEFRDGSWRNLTQIFPVEDAA